MTTRIRGGCSSAHYMQLCENAPSHTVGCTTLGWLKRHGAIYWKGEETVGATKENPGDSLGPWI